MKLKINWDHARCKHALHRMWLRGIALDEAEKGILKGKKVIQKETELVEAFYKFYSIIYDEKIYKVKKIRKIYPITVKLW